MAERSEVLFLCVHVNRTFIRIKVEMTWFGAHRESRFETDSDDLVVDVDPTPFECEREPAHEMIDKSLATQGFGIESA